MKERDQAHRRAARLNRQCREEGTWQRWKVKYYTRKECEALGPRALARWERGDRYEVVCANPEKNPITPEERRVAQRVNRELTRAFNLG